ncbi:MAG: glucan biosynthesis protein [Rhodospirillaceae bacterium]|nr:glucan biosynthesis protein [Rhodospirillaceae bacterium]
MNVSRRHMLSGSAALAFAAGMGLPAHAARLGDKAQPFSAQGLIDIAEQAAKKPFDAAAPKLPGFIEKLDYDAYRDVRFRADQALWREQNLPFTAQFFHLGSVYKRPVHIFEVADGAAREVLFDTGMFDYGKNKFDEKVPDTLGFAGFRLHYALNRPDYQDELVSFLGASYFRSLGRGEVYGLSARGLAIDTGVPTGEEFPFFRAFYVERPRPGATSITVHALLDSRSVTGAYSFAITPGKSTLMDVKVALFPRRKVERLGIAPLTSMFLHGDTTPPRTEDFRPNVHDSEGLSIWTTGGDWIWRPLANPKRLRLSLYSEANIRGFGLLQRNRDFREYQDLEAHYERRPGLWVEPVAGFGPGAVWLVEIPADAEIHDNIVAYWMPANQPDPGKRLDLAYRLHWGAEPPHRSAVAQVTATRTGLGGYAGKPVEGLRKFVVDFRGGALDKIAEASQIEPVITVSEGKIAHSGVQRLPGPAGWRLVFDFRPERSRPQELRAFLKRGAEVLTETWSFQWTG